MPHPPSPTRAVNLTRDRSGAGRGVRVARALGYEAELVFRPIQKKP